VKDASYSLYYYLAEHPNLIPSSEKEIEFFTPELYNDWPEHPRHRVLCAQDPTWFFGMPHTQTYCKKMAWYHGHFPLPHELGDQRMTYEATPEYLYYPEAAERIFKYDPSIKLIVLLRNPVERAFSAWNMYCRFGEGDYRPLIYAPRRETRGFDESVRTELKDIQSDRFILEPGYLRRGLYHEQLCRFFKFFSRDQVLVLESRALREETSHVLEQVIRFLQLPEYTYQRHWPPFHVGQYETQVVPETLRLLRDFYRPRNLELFELLNQDFGWQ
jgi:hypothetical protein